MDSDLPRNLAYLADTMAYLLSLEPDEIDESTDTSILVAALRKRVVGVSGRTAGKRLREDAQSLRDWLVSRPDHPGHFVLAYMESCDGSVADLRIDEPQAAKPRTSAKKRTLVMDAPAGFTSTSIKGNLFLMNEAARHPVSRNGACSIAVMCLAEPLVDQTLTIIDQQSDHKGGTPVAFGEWTGRKDSFADRVFYHLSRAGVNVQVVVQAIGASSDEVEVESVLASISVT